jgi:hypothetical protein
MVRRAASRAPPGLPRHAAPRVDARRASHTPQPPARPASAPHTTPLTTSTPPARPPHAGRLPRVPGPLRVDGHGLRRHPGQQAGQAGGQGRRQGAPRWRALRLPLVRRARRSAAGCECAVTAACPPAFAERHPGQVPEQAHQRAGPQQLRGAARRGAARRYGAAILTGCLAGWLAGSATERACPAPALLPLPDHHPRLPACPPRSASPPRTCACPPATPSSPAAAARSWATCWARSTTPG